MLQTLFARRRYNLLIAFFSCVLVWQVINRRTPTDVGWWGQPNYHVPELSTQWVDHVGSPKPHFDWSTLAERFPVKGEYSPLPENPGRAGIPKIQAESFPVKDDAARQMQRYRLEMVRSNFTHAWHGYRFKAWMKDEVAPLSGGFHNSFGGWGATLVDALGTLWIVGNEREFDDAVGAMHNIDFSSCALDELNVFETTIRYLGGFLSAYDLSKQKYGMLLEKAIELGDMLYHCFDTPNRMPITRWDWKSALGGGKQIASDFVLVAELGSLTLEMTRLSQLTGDPKYYDAVKRVMDVFEAQQQKTHLPGMWPVVVDAKNQDLTKFHTFTIGGMADSAYEYLPKQHQLLNGAVPGYRKMYDAFLKTMKEKILYRPMTPDQRDMLMAGQIETDGSIPLDDLAPDSQGQHLACFAGGMVGLGAKLFSSPADLEVAKRLTEGCLWAYETATLGIMPEIIHTVPCPDLNACPWDQQKWEAAVLEAHAKDQNVQTLIAQRHLAPGVSKIDDGRYILRPEAIESVFYMYRLTGDPSYQERAWTMFENIVKHTKTDIAHAALADCTVPDPPKMDKMESFWLAETLRYFYLIFADENVVSLDEWVFNTEAHPLRRPE